jgi:RNA polymerase sigma factor (sigma-70 family)
VDDLDFTEVYRRHGQDVYRFAVYLAGDVHVAEDVTAETFARAWAGRGRIRASSVKAYLIAIARNLCRDVHRARKTSTLDVDAAPVNPDPDQERTAQARQELQLVLRAMDTLPELDRAILAMTAIEGLSYQVIGDCVGLSETAVKVRIHRARVRLIAARQQREVRS